LQRLHDANDFGGLFAAIRKERGYSMGKKAAADTPTLEDFVPHFQNLFANESSSTPDHERYLPTQHTVKEELGQPFTKNELLTALMITKSKSAQ